MPAIDKLQQNMDKLSDGLGYLLPIVYRNRVNNQISAIHSEYAKVELGSQAMLEVATDAMRHLEWAGDVNTLLLLLQANTEAVAGAVTKLHERLAQERQEGDK